MSIDAVRKLVEKPACGAVVGGISILLAASFVMSGSCRLAGMGGNGQAGPDAASKEPAVVTVGKFDVTESDIDREKQAFQMQGPTTPAQDAQMVGYALRTIMDRGYALDLAASQGVVLTDDQMLKLLDKQIDESLMQMKMQAQMSGKLKSGTDADFDKFLQTQVGKSKAEYKSGTLNEFKTKVLADPRAKVRAEGSFVLPILIDKAAATIKPTDDDLKAQFETLNLKKVFIRSTPDEKKAKETIDKAAAELKGGSPFEKVMTLYSTDTPDPGKTLAETVSKMNGASIQADDGLKPLLKLKPGQVSDVLKTDTGYGIYKLISIDSTFKQADFDKQKSDLAKNYGQQQAQKQIMDALEKLKKSNGVPVKWLSKGYELVYDLSQLPEQKLSQSEMQKKFEEIANEASTAKDTVSPRMLAVARYVAFSSVWNATAPDKRNALVDQRIESINSVLQYMEGVDLRLELVDALSEAKKGPEAVSMLLQAAKFNTDLDARGQSDFNKINAKILDLKDKGLLNATDQKAIEDEQNRWKSDRADKMKAEAEQRKAAEEDRKRAEDERKKAEAEAKKPVKPISRDEAQKAAQPGSTSSSTPPVLNLGGAGKK